MKKHWLLAAVAALALTGDSGGEDAEMGRGARDRLARPLFLRRDFHPVGAEPRL